MKLTLILVAITLMIVVINGQLKEDEFVKRDGLEKHENKRGLLRLGDRRRCDAPVPGHGRCRFNFRKFYYDAASNTCRQFFWGGCDRTNNHFDILGVCQRMCIRKVLPPPPPPRSTRPPPPPPTKIPQYQWFDKRRCLGAPIRGPCNKNIRRYYYDSELNECLEFSFGGCNRYPNNWDYLKNCQKICVTSVPEPTQTPTPVPTPTPTDAPDVEDPYQWTCKPKAPCAPLSSCVNHHCKHGFQNDNNGCPVCRCLPPPKPCQS